MKHSVRLPAFAKINLSLEILGRRPDGYHELRTIFQAISLHDTLALSVTSRPGITLEIDDPALPTGSENLLYRAIDAVRAALAPHETPEGVRLGAAAWLVHARS